MKNPLFRRRDAHLRNINRYNTCAALDVGLLQGSVVLALEGETAVEDLRIGQRIVTHDAGVSKIVHIQRVERAIGIVEIAASAFGDARPNRHLTLAAAQKVLMHGEHSMRLFGAEKALVPAAMLSEAAGADPPQKQDCVFYQIFCQDPHILFCDGLALGTPDAAPAGGGAARLI